MQSRPQHVLLLFCILAFFACGKRSERDSARSTPQERTPKTAKEPYDADLVIYGGTSAAITAGVQAVRLGKSVIIVSPDKHLGGLSAGGLGFTDTGKKEVIGGLAREFYHRIYLHYQQEENWKWQKQDEYGNKGQGTPAIDGAERTMWIFEPHAAEAVFEDFARENNLTIYRDEWLDRQNGVQKQAGRIVSIRTLSGKTFTGRMFIDATYEGDLMAAAGVTYHVGREANSVYGETYNGVQTGVFHHGHHFKTNVDPYKVPGNPASGLLPRIASQAPGEKGAGDHTIQAYCFRMCLSNHPQNRIPFSKPERYDPSQYELLVRVFDAGWRELFNKYDPIPNRKTDTNNHGPFSTDNIGMNYDYPEAAYERRREIIREHETYQKGLLYFMATDPRVPKDVQRELNTWGLAKDEFTDNGGWPHQLYVREARRMVSDYVMTEHETLGRKPVARPVGMGSYTLDSHHTQRYVKPDGYVQNEGDIGVAVKAPYQIDYGALVPKKQECENLLVPVCLSSSHIAYGSIRMEPVFMILGQSAATAAAQAIDRQVAVQAIDYAQLEAQLRKDKQVLSQAQHPR
ncbi:MAG: FAD-dependent oxidoreductase [Cytophagales bacterium]|nr:FAD-dependent oxidoreductase [Cytophagales bacterium]